MGRLWTPVAERLAFGFLTIIVVSLLVAVGVDVLPGDAAQNLLGHSATPETVAALRKELGLDQPLYLRYFTWLGDFIQGDMGTSLANQREIAQLVGTGLGHTVFLAVEAALIAIPLAIVFAMLAARYRETLLDKAICMMTLSGISFPVFFVAYVLIALLAVHNQLFPVVSSISPGMTFLGKIYVVSLPALTLALAVAPHMIRMTRSALISVGAGPVIEMASREGSRRSRNIIPYALPDVLFPITKVMLMNLAYLVVGVVVVEVVFAYPGLGQLFVESLSKRDLPVMQACSLVFAVIYVLLNLAADVVAILANSGPRHPN